MVNDEIVAVHKQLMSSLEIFMDALDSRDSSRIMQSLEAMKSAAAVGQATTSQKESPSCNTLFLPSALKMFQFYQDAAKKEYLTIAGFYCRDSISYREYDSLQVMIQEVELHQKNVDQTFLDAQQSFASSCGFKLIRNAD
jgi:hypothetical protein